LSGADRRERARRVGAEGMVLQQLGEQGHRRRAGGPEGAEAAQQCGTPRRWGGVDRVELLGERPPIDADRRAAGDQREQGGERCAEVRRAGRHASAGYHGRSVSGRSRRADGFAGTAGAGSRPRAALRGASPPDPSSPMRSRAVVVLPLLAILLAAAFVADRLRQAEDALIARRYADAGALLQPALAEEPVERHDRVLLLLARA